MLAFFVRVGVWHNFHTAIALVMVWGWTILFE